LPAQPGQLEESVCVHEVPRVVRNRVLAAGAQAWLEALPDLVRELEREWAIRLGEVFPDATEAFVAEATQEDGTPAVLKVVVPHGAAARHEITVLRLCAGEGCAALLRHDTVRGALLVERLGPSMHALGLPVVRRHELLYAAARRVWRAAGGVDLPGGAEKARRLKGCIVQWWEELNHPCSEAAVVSALACADRREAAHDPARAVLVHGDVHQWNALRSRDGFKLVDPDGLVAEAEYDLGIVMREDPLELLQGDPMDRARRLAELSGLDATAIWEWGVVERVSTGLLGLRDGLEPEGRRMLHAADCVAR
jgi:streptomycin 6-kinase